MQDRSTYSEPFKNKKISKKNLDKVRQKIRNFYKNKSKNKIKRCIEDMHKLKISLREAQIYCGVIR